MKIIYFVCHQVLHMKVANWIGFGRNYREILKISEKTFANIFGAKALKIEEDSDLSREVNLIELLLMNKQIKNEQHILAFV